MSAGCSLYPQKRTWITTVVMSALCQKRTFRPALDIIVGGQGCSSSWSITREASPPKAISVSRRGRRRAAVHVVLCLGAGLPTRPVRIIVGYAPGGATDIMARLAGQWLSERLGQQFVIE